MSARLRYYIIGDEGTTENGGASGNGVTCVTIMSTRKWKWCTCVTIYVHSQVNMVYMCNNIYVHSQVEMVYMCNNICPLASGNGYV